LVLNPTSDAARAGDLEREVTPAAALDPDPDVRYPAMEALRQSCPVQTLAPGRHLVLSHNAVESSLRGIDNFGGSAGQDGLPEEDTTIAAILEPRHGQIRRIINSVVALHRSQQIEPYLREFVATHMQAVIVQARTGYAVEVMRAFVDPLPPAAMARLMGFPEGDLTTFRTLGRGAAAEFGRAAAEGRSLSLRQASPEMAAYVDAQIETRVKQPPDEWPNDALSRFLTTEVDGERLGHRAIATQIMFAIGAGSDTTRHTLGSLLYRLAGDQQLYQRLRGDRSLIEPVIEETLRHDPPAQFLVRQCLTEGVELDGVPVAAGDWVLLSIGSANRDGKVFPDPDGFDPERPNLKGHVAFGSGPHICPGSALARLELRLALSCWCDSVESFELAPGHEWEPLETGMLHGPKRLLLLISPA
jgi:cytochrome P450